MDELTAALASSFDVSSGFNKISAPHPRFSQFKVKSSNQDQDSRRRCLLEFQKKNRFDFLNHVRKLTEDDWKDDNDALCEEEESMETEVAMKKPGRYYKDQLMYSEWLVEVPCDFATEWLMVLCPVGKRCLVVTNKYSTKAYSKSGYCINSFPSFLPGGHYSTQNRPSCSVLDCLYSEVNKTYYILDLMCWNGHSIYDTETEFRFFWLREKIKETPEVTQASKVNPMKFIPLPNFPCAPEAISAAVASANFEIDGLLFFHKRTHYMFGSTPLVVWLKPYMLPEILGIEVPQCQLGHQPADYTNYANHMKKVAEGKEKAQLEKAHGIAPSRNYRGRGRSRGRTRGPRQAMEAECVEVYEAGDSSKCEPTEDLRKKFKESNQDTRVAQVGECEENNCDRLDTGNIDSASTWTFNSEKGNMTTPFLANACTTNEDPCNGIRDDVMVEEKGGHQLT